MTVTSTTIPSGRDPAALQPETLPSDPDHAERRDALAGRLFEATLGAFDLISIYLGIRLDLYRVLGDLRARTAAELASEAGIAERYAREWLEQQAVTGILEADGVEDGRERRYRLPAAHAEVLLDPDSLSTMAPMPLFVVGATRRMPDILDAYRTGGGVPWAAYGDDVLSAQEAANRPIFRHLLAREWFASIPEVDDRLRRPGARVADVGMGAGWSSIAIAREYPLVEVDGIDPDSWSVARATANADTAGVSDRVRFHETDAAHPDLAGQYDVALVFEALHDLAQPVEVLSAVRGLLKPGGIAIVVDERVAERFAAPGDDVDRLMYGYSITTCLVNGMAESPTAATGTVMRPALVEQAASDAGFSSTTVLPIEHDVFRVYRLDP